MKNLRKPGRLPTAALLTALVLLIGTLVFGGTSVATQASSAPEPTSSRGVSGSSSSQPITSRSLARR